MVVKVNIKALDQRKCPQYWRPTGDRLKQVVPVLSPCIIQLPITSPPTHHDYNSGTTLCIPSTRLHGADMLPKGTYYLAWRERGKHVDNNYERQALSTVHPFAPVISIVHVPAAPYLNSDSSVRG